MFADLRHALRMLAKSPAFTAIAVVTLAVGIGSATVVFTAINALLIKPLPHLSKELEARLLYASQTDRVRGNDDLGWSYPDHAAVAARATTLEGLWVHTDRTVIIAGTDEPQRIAGTEISWNAFSLLQVPPILGRPFNATDSDRGAPIVALISHRLWQSRFGGDPAIVGTSVTLNGQPATLIGVMPDGWRYPDFTDLWTPLQADTATGSQRGNFYLSSRALLKPGFTVDQAQAELDSILGGIAAEFPATNAGIGGKFRLIREEATADIAHLTILLFGAVLAVLLIACLNVANLLLARGVGRAKELAIRLALGASRGRIIRQLVTESLLLGLLGGVGGLVLSLWGADAMVAAIPVEIPFWLRFDFDGRVFAFVFALSLATALGFGLVPAIKSSRPDVISEIKEGGRSGAVDGPRATRLRHLLVIAEVALAMVLLVGAGLMLRSFLHLSRVDPGFDHRNVLTFRTGYPIAMYGKDESIPARFFAELLQQLGTRPGVEAVGVVSNLPGTGGYMPAVLLEGQPEPAHHTEAPLVHDRSASPGYFTALRIPLKAGRLFDDAIDRPDSPRVVLVDETFAQRHFGGNEAALGKRVRSLKTPTDEEEPVWHEIVGVVGSIRHHLAAAAPAPTLYTSTTQRPINFLSVVLRTASDPAAYAELARETTLAVDSKIPIYDVLTLNGVLLRSDDVWTHHFFSRLFAVFGLIALFLASIGVYGVMTYAVAQRTPEIGMRMALGAQSRDVVAMVLRQGLRIVLIGLAIGLAGAWFAARLLAGTLYGISPHDPPTFALVPLLLAAVALFACYLPSRRATLITPLIALRTK